MYKVYFIGEDSQETRVIGLQPYKWENIFFSLQTSAFSVLKQSGLNNLYNPSSINIFLSKFPQVYMSKIVIPNSTLSLESTFSIAHTAHVEKYKRTVSEK